MTKVRLVFSVCVMIALLALGSASAKNPAGSSNDYLALGASLVFAFIDQAGYEYSILQTSSDMQIGPA